MSNQYPTLSFKVNPNNLKPLAYLAELLDTRSDGLDDEEPPWLTYGPAQDQLYALVETIQLYEYALTRFLNDIERNAIPGMANQPEIVKRWRAIQNALGDAINREPLEPFQP